jgi:hypothetical protein
METEDLEAQACLQMKKRQVKLSVERHGTMRSPLAQNRVRQERVTTVLRERLVLLALHADKQEEEC